MQYDSTAPQITSYIMMNSPVKPFEQNLNIMTFMTFGFRAVEVDCISFRPPNKQAYVESVCIIKHVLRPLEVT